jgi:small subunit ribosomal protein S17e
MGRIKTRKVKAITVDLLEQYREQFGTDFDVNKLKVSEFTGVKSKKLRNIIAGYTTRLMKTESK